MAANFTGLDNFAMTSDISNETINLAYGSHTVNWSVYCRENRGKVLDKKTGQVRDMTKTERAERFLDEAVNGESEDESGPTLSGMNLNPNANILTTSS